MPEKKAPLGICDLCNEPFPSGVSVHTTKGQPRLFCSHTCRNTANSRAGAPIRSEKTRERIQRGEWRNPAESFTDEELYEYARRGGRVRARQHREALAEGTWQNPANAPGAREKLSRPRRHADDPVLHSAIEKLGAGLCVTPISQRAFWNPGIGNNRLPELARNVGVGPRKSADSCLTFLPTLLPPGKLV